MSKEIRGELRELLEAATKEPWGVPMPYMDSEVTALTDGGTPFVLCNMNWHMVRSEADRKLIIAMRNALPWLLDDLDEKDAEIERLSVALRLAQVRAKDAEAWNDSDCNTCPLRTWSACEEICASKSTMAEYAAKLANDIDVKLDALLKTEARVGALERFTAQFHAVKCAGCMQV